MSIPGVQCWFDPAVGLWCEPGSGRMVRVRDGMSKPLVPGSCVINRNRPSSVTAGLRSEFFRVDTVTVSGSHVSVYGDTGDLIGEVDCAYSGLDVVEAPLRDVLGTEPFFGVVTDAAGCVVSVGDVVTGDLMQPGLGVGVVEDLFTLDGWDGGGPGVAVRYGDLVSVAWTRRLLKVPCSGFRWTNGADLSVGDVMLHKGGVVYRVQSVWPTDMESREGEYGVTLMKVAGLSGDLDETPAGHVFTVTVGLGGYQSGAVLVLDGLPA